MDTIFPLLKEPFVWGLLLGLLIAGFFAKSAFSAKIAAAREKRRLTTELDELKSHLHRQMTIDARGQAAIQDEIGSLKEQNENLRIRIAELQQKPDRQIQRRLETYEHTLRTLREQAPGFASAWENALRQAETVIDSHDRGFRQLISRVVPGMKSKPALPMGSSAGSDALQSPNAGNLAPGDTSSGGSISNESDFPTR